MQPHLRQPSAKFCRQALARLEGLPLSYWERGATAWSRMPQGYTHAEETVSLGFGEEVWASAKTAFRNWAFYPEAPWIQLSHYPPLAAEQQVMVRFHALGLWWLSPCRIVYTVDDDNTCGMAYGTLPGHVEAGEELFLLQHDPVTAEVTYTIRVMARAANPLAKLVPPFVSYMQARFRKTSFAQMGAAVNERLVHRGLASTAVTPVLA